MHTSTDGIAGGKSTKSKANRIEIELAIAYRTRSAIIIFSCWNVLRVASTLRYRLQKYLDRTERRKHTRRIAQLSHRRCTFIGDSKAIRTTRGKRSTEFSNVAFPSLGCSIYSPWKEREGRLKRSGRTREQRLSTMYTGDRWFILEIEQKRVFQGLLRTRCTAIGSLIGRRNVTTTITDRPSTPAPLSSVSPLHLASSIIHRN